MNEPRRSAIAVQPYRAAGMPEVYEDRPPAPPRPSLGTRVLGWALLGASVGVVSCQSLFSL